MWQHGLSEVEVRGAEHVREAMEDGCGVLITPNHPSHADPFALQEAADGLGTPLYFMTAWQVFAMTHRLGRQVLRRHGCFSVNREGHDLRAFRQAVEILEHRNHPLVIFPEGEVFHLNDRTMPFRRGAALAALSAARRSGRPVACVPCGITFEYVTDPTPRLLEVMDLLERRMSWTSRPGTPLIRRIERFAERMLSIKELEHFGETRHGAIQDRQAELLDTILMPLESRYGADGSGLTVPERVKRVRRLIIACSEAASDCEHRQFRLREDMDALFFVMQLFSYPADYLAGSPSLERLSETLDKFEEDVLGVPTATKRGVRRAVVSFGAPIQVGAFDSVPRAAQSLTRVLRSRVQELIDEIRTSQPRTPNKIAPASADCVSPDHTEITLPLAG
ncbi:MAG: lysophospholipid acyltransferase family protein [Planctomycetaceae bacterium]